MNSFVLQTRFGSFYTEQKKDGKFHAINHHGTTTTELIRTTLDDLIAAVREVRE